VGGNYYYYKYRGFVSFDTSSISTSATVATATLKLKTGTYAPNPSFELKIIGGIQPIYGSSLGTEDWSAGSSVIVTWNTGNFMSETYLNLEIPADQINKGGRTQFRLVSSRDEQNISPWQNENMNFYSGNSAGNEPILEITYMQPHPSYWSQRRPSVDTNFYTKIESDVHNSISWLSLSTEVAEYDENWQGTGSDLLGIRVLGTAHTRYGISYTYVEGDGQELWPMENPIGLTGDDAGAWISIPAFPYYGAWYDSVWVCSNGFLSFTSELTSPRPAYITDSSEPNTIIAPFWRDLDPSKGGVIKTGWWTYTGCDILIISWDHVPNKVNANTQTFQVALGVNGWMQGEIWFVYGDITKDVLTSAGLEDQSGRRGASYNTGGISHGRIVQFTPQNMDHNIRTLKVTAEKPAGGDTDAELHIWGIDDAKPGGVNVRLYSTEDGAYVEKFVAAADLAIMVATLAFDVLTPIGTIWTTGTALATLLSPTETQPTDILDAGRSDPRVYTTAYANDEVHDDGHYVWDASFAMIILWRLYDSNTRTHDLKITFELSTGGPGDEGLSTCVDFHLYVSSGGGGCPNLYVWDGVDYVCEGLLNIHDPDGVDLVYQHTLVSTPQRENGAYLLRLTEHHQTHSYIDQVKLYAILEDGTMKRLPLIYAWHSEDGNVLPQLLFSDEWKTDTLGADLNNGTSQSIDLKFASLSPNLEIVGFVFEIEGNNMILKR